MFLINGEGGVSLNLINEEGWNVPNKQGGFIKEEGWNVPNYPWIMSKLFCLFFAT